LIASNHGISVLFTFCRRSTMGKCESGSSSKKARVESTHVQVKQEMGEGEVTFEGALVAVEATAPAEELEDL
jgi:uncharacterized protein (UPF0548 family)